MSPQTVDFDADQEGRLRVTDIIGQAIDPTRIDQEQVDGRSYWQLIPDVEYSVDGNQRKGALLVAPVLGFERSIIRVLDGTEHEMSPAYYMAEILLDSSYSMLTMRFFRVEVGGGDPSQAHRRLVDAVPSPLIEDFIPRLRRLVEGAIRVVRPGPASFDVLAEEAKKSTTSKKAAPKKKSSSPKKKAAPAKKKTTSRKSAPSKRKSS